MASLVLARRGVIASALLLAAACHRSGGHSSTSSSNWAVSNVRLDGYGTPSSPDLDFGALGAGYFVEQGSTFIELPSGKAHLRAFVRGGANDERVWQVSLDLRQRLAPLDENYAQRAEPRLDLDSGAYVAHGGVVDPASWSYWELASGELVGLDTLAGARATLASPTRWCVQRGFGASNRGLENGLEASLTVTVVSQPLAGATFSTTPFDARVGLALRNGAEHVAHDPQIDPLVATSAHGALEIPGIGTFDIAAGGEIVERLDGSAHIEAQLTDAGGSERRFEIALDLSQRVDASSGAALPGGSPWLELPLDSYRQNGGPIDVGAWHYYKKLGGELRGLGDLAGARIAITTAATRAQVGLGAHGASLKLGASTRLALRTTAQPSVGPALPFDPADATLRLELAREYIACASESSTDPAYATGNTLAITVPDLADDFVFEAGGTFREHLDGTAELRGIVRSSSTPQNRWQVEIAFDSRLDEGSVGFPPPGSPRLELAPNAYVNDGGVIDPNRWHYYMHLEGQLIGLDANAGARIGVERVGTTAAQIGAGANGRNLRGSASARLAYTLVHNAQSSSLPTTLADGDLRIEIHRGCGQCPQAAERDPAVSNVAGGFALSVAGLANDLVLEAGANFVERADGTARLEGTLVREIDGLPRFTLALELRERLDPGAASYPPAGSPRLQLMESAYDDHGGTVAPSTWTYFRGVEGQLVGVGPYAGARLALSRSGSSAQFGLGANGKNLRYGASSTLAVTLLAQPTLGAHFDPNGTALLAIDVAKTCE